MSKVLIIDDHLEIAKEVQKDLSQYNPNLFSDKNVFCLEKKDDTFGVVPIIEAKDLNHFDNEAVLSVFPKTMGAILSFLKENEHEHILILIDDFLRADDKEVTLGWTHSCVIDNLSAYI